MFRCRTEGHEQTTVETEARDLVTDAFLCAWSCRLDVLPELFEGGPIVGAERRKVVVDVCGIADGAVFFTSGPPFRVDPSPTVGFGSDESNGTWNGSAAGNLASMGLHRG
ncbi:MAG: hypothetical protein IPF53_21085 [Blastocatellia bacterium]|nr:hypothetical protein [Blastocatellia bacterium]